MRTIKKLTAIFALIAFVGAGAIVVTPNSAEAGFPVSRTDIPVELQQLATKLIEIAQQVIFHGLDGLDIGSLLGMVLSNLDIQIGNLNLGNLISQVMNGDIMGAITGVIGEVAGDLKLDLGKGLGSIGLQEVVKAITSGNFAGVADKLIGAAKTAGMAALKKELKPLADKVLSSVKKGADGKVERSAASVGAAITYAGKVYGNAASGGFVTASINNYKGNVSTARATTGDTPTPRKDEDKIDLSKAGQDAIDKAIRDLINGGDPKDIFKGAAADLLKLLLGGLGGFDDSGMSTEQKMAGLEKGMAGAEAGAAVVAKMIPYSMGEVQQEIVGTLKRSGASNIQTATTISDIAAKGRERYVAGIIAVIGKYEASVASQDKSHRPASNAAIEANEDLLKKAQEFAKADATTALPAIVQLLNTQLGMLMNIHISIVDEIDVQADLVRIMGRAALGNADGLGDALARSLNIVNETYVMREAAQRVK